MRSKWVLGKDVNPLVRYYFHENFYLVKYISMHSKWEHGVSYSFSGIINTHTSFVECKLTNLYFVHKTRG